MPSAAIEQSLQAATEHLQAGRLQQAEAACRQILATQPTHAEALNLLAVIAAHVGRHDHAARLIAQAIAAAPQNPGYHFHLGIQQQTLGRLDDAIASYQRAIDLRPDYAEAFNNLGLIRKNKGQLDMAIACYRRALALRPNLVQTHISLGAALALVGQLDEAIACYHRALSLDPNNVDAARNIGNALLAKGQSTQAIDCFQHLVKRNPNLFEAHLSLANACRDSGQSDEAVQSYQRALSLRPDSVEALCGLGVTYKQIAQFDQAIDCYTRALALNPNSVEAHCNVGVAYRLKGQLESAIASYQRALAVNPNFVQANFNLANALKELGRFDQAVTFYQRALAINPKLAEAHCNLGIALEAIGQLDQAIASYQRAIDLDPNYFAAHSNLGNVVKSTDQLDAAIACYHRALDINPTSARTHNNLGVAWESQGRHDLAIASYRRALEIDPHFHGTHDNLLYSLPFHEHDAAVIRAESRIWNDRHAQPLERFARPHENDRDPHRPLRVGYVAAEFFRHASAFFLLPLFRNHDRRQIELFAYSQVPRPDDETKKFQDLVPHWRHNTGLADTDIADRIRADRIDILVDLSLHMAHNRLLVFARKPAPVQITYLGYPGTTGLAAMDYRLTDPYLDPPGSDDTRYTEKTIRLPETFWCYDPLTNEPPVNSPPCAPDQPVTFGCLNSFRKVNPAVLSLWAAVLRTVPHSRFILMAPQGDARNRVVEQFHAQNIAPDRIEFLDRQRRDIYLKTHHRIDIALDTFPYNGHTTSLDALWMGVPVITLVGQTVVGRAGLSQLTNLGLPELIAYTPEQFVRVAADLAADRRRLADLRATLRSRMERSVLMDAPRFARNIEAAYRSAWQNWCAS